MIPPSTRSLVRWGADDGETEFEGLRRQDTRGHLIGGTNRDGEMAMKRGDGGEGDGEKTGKGKERGSEHCD